MSWVTLVLNFLKGFLVDVFIKANTTPGVENDITVQNGDAKRPPKSYYADKYGLHNRDKGKE